MKKMVMTIHWRRVFAGAAAVTILSLMVAGSPLHALWVLMMILAASALAGALWIGRGGRTRSMSDVIDDVDTEASPPVARATAPTLHRGGPS